MSAHFYTLDGELTNSTGIPSVSTILAVRHNERLWEWKLRLGAEAEQKTLEAQAKGTEAHAQIEAFLKTKAVPSDSAYFKGFQSWYDKYQPTDIKSELFVHHKEHGYAGKLDLFCHIDGEPWIVDFKTSKKISPSMGLQLVAYQIAFESMCGVRPRMAILQINDGRTARGFRFVEMAEPFEVFLAHKAIFDWGVKTGMIEFPYTGGVISA